MVRIFHKLVATKCTVGMHDGIERGGAWLEGSAS
jgi:hypothetical protein